MVSLLFRLDKIIRKYSKWPVVRQRLLEQSLLLQQLRYVKGKLSLNQHVLVDFNAFNKFMRGFLKPSRMQKGVKNPLLHSFVLTLLIALGDEPKLRKKVGAFLQKRDKQQKRLAKLFEKHPSYYAHYLSLLPFESENYSKRLLQLAG